MPYTTLAALVTKMPLVHITEALDDAGEGLDDEGLQAALDAVIETADNEIDSLLGGRFTVPFSAPPAKVKHASLIFTLESLAGGKRSIPDEKNLWTKKANALRKELKEIGDGDAPLTPGTDNAASSRPPGVVIAGNNPAISSCGHLIF